MCDVDGDILDARVRLKMRERRNGASRDGQRLRSSEGSVQTCIHKAVAGWCSGSFTHDGAQRQSAERERLVGESHGSCFYAKATEY